MTRRCLTVVEQPTARPTAKPRLPLGTKSKAVAKFLHPCQHRGEVIGSAICAEGCGKGSATKDVYSCSLHGRCTVAVRAVGVEHCCRDCPDKTERPAKPVAHQTQFAPRSGDVPVGVAIGSYRWPSLVDLQIRVIRHTCGEVPILVSSDDPESSGRIDEICSRHADVFHWPNVERIGHTGGDIAAYFKGSIWGRSRGLKVVAKLSQRMLFTRARWLQDGARDLLASGCSLGTQRCRGTQRFDLRTEAALLDVATWSRPEVLSRIMPRRYWGDTPQGLTAETVIYRVLKDLCGEIFHPWGIIGEERLQPREGVIWHNANEPAEYHKLAKDFGVSLERDFHVHGWQQERGLGQYLYG